MTGTGDLLTDLKLSVEYETAKLTLMACNSVRELVDTWWSTCDQHEGIVRQELAKVYVKKLKALGVSVAA